MAEKAVSWLLSSGILAGSPALEALLALALSWGSSGLPGTKLPSQNTDRVHILNTSRLILKGGQLFQHLW